LFSSNPFWLDAHRLTAVVLERLGTPFVAARNAVVLSLREFLQRLPGVEQGTFKKVGKVQHCFADDRTKLWIGVEVLASREAVESAAPAGERALYDESPPWAAVRREADALLVGGDLAAALDLFMQGRSASRTSRERFLWTLKQADFCLAAGEASLAFGLLEHLDDQADDFGLEEWEPALSMEVAHLLMLCHARVEPMADGTWLEARQQRVARAHSRLCRLNPKLVASLGSGAHS
jgi:type VI secretion system protein VasJ